MIYKVYLIDADSGISIFEVTFRELKKIQDDILTGFFQVINKTIDVIQESMTKGRRVNEMNRIVESEDSTILIYFHPLSRVLFCSISDADDDTEKIEEIIHNIATRFWKKHQSDLKVFRATTEKSRFQTFSADVENLTIGGRIAEVYPKLLVVKKVLEKVLLMGMIDEIDFQIALLCTGNSSPLKISRSTKKKKKEIHDILKKLDELDIIEF
ncbi:hypothetical protein LCGC14_1193330 [marine sediment metagenome]|uniref:Uncharacterized protein n=1 Tax=marine sediment metagenome TaxID=412755 RepID=A0A0F9P1H0_9ZZZZ